MTATHEKPLTPLTPLTPQEHQGLEACEKVIEQGRSIFLEVGAALARIRDKRLYRASHRTFEEYCRERWDFSQTHTNRMIATGGKKGWKP